MFENIKKRDGRAVEFDSSKIISGKKALNPIKEFSLFAMRLQGQWLEKRARR